MNTLKLSLKLSYDAKEQDVLKTLADSLGFPSVERYLHNALERQLSADANSLIQAAKAARRDAHDAAEAAQFSLEAAKQNLDAEQRAELQRLADYGGVSPSGILLTGR